MIFSYVFLIGVILCRVIPGYQLSDVLHILCAGSSGNNNVNMFEIFVSFTFHHLSVVYIVKSIEKVNVLYDYIRVRVKDNKSIFNRIIQTVSSSILSVVLQKIFADVLLMILERTCSFTIEYLYQSVIGVTTFMLIGLLGIFSFYNSFYSNKVAMILGMLMLVFVFLNIHGIYFASIIIPNKGNDGFNMLNGLCLKILIIILVYMYLQHKNLRFERINKND